MKRKATTIIILVALVVAIAVLTTAAYLAFPKNLEQVAPKKIDTVQRTKTLTGFSAISASKSSHVGKLKNPSDATIITYDNQTTIWISSYPEEKDAHREAERMAEAMRRFRRGFEKWERIKVNGASIFRTHPKGETHYFWQYKTMIIYIAPQTLTEEQVKNLIKEINFKIRLYSMLNK